MDYKQVIDEQIEILKDRQKETKNSIRADIVCLYADTISKLVTVGSNLKSQPIKASKEVKQNAKE